MKNVKQKTRIIFPPVQSKPDSLVEEEAVTSKKGFDAFRDEKQCADREPEQNVDDCGLEKFGQYFSPDVVQNLNKMSDDTNQQNEDKDADLQRMNYAGAETLAQRLSPNVVQNLGEKLNGTKKKSKYEPHSSYKYSTVDCNFMEIITSVMKVYSVDNSNLNAGGQKYHLNEYINEFRHYAVVLTEIKKLAEIIPLCLQACNFYEKKGIDFYNHPRYKDKDSSDLFDVLFEEGFPQQPSGSL
ncbi:hypothetical protein CQW23_10636 [Capsicum baccatum]|uniref:Uncharacterized protein n=1 Tax=Capsicum baccatum TaxID=33114 RepID=A0A2G2X0D7_CAPBA|nr:hypothetical protein CQW23_10636 [Capsicum baccatum]